MKHRLFKKDAAILFASVAASFLFVVLITFASTTISTNVNTGGTLTVSGASTLTGAVWASSTLQATGVSTLYNDLVVDTSTLVVDSTNNRVGVGTTSPAAFFSVGGNAGTNTGHLYLTGALTVGATTSINTDIGTILLASSRNSDPTGIKGMLYYNDESDKIRYYNGSSWGVIGTSTGLDLIGNNIRMVTPSANYFTLGTTTAQGASLMTLEATSTLAIPLTLVGRNSQTANLFQIMDVGSNNLFTVNYAGQSSTTMLTTTGDLFVNGFATTTALSGNFATKGTLTVTGTADITGKTTMVNASSTRQTISDILMMNGFATTTSEGNITTKGTLTVTGTSDFTGKVTAVNASTTRVTVSDYASTTSLIIGSGSTISGMIFGYCTIPTVTIQASSTDYADCSGATGIRLGDRVTIQATSSLPVSFVITAASSTGANLINVRIRNHGDSTGTVLTGVNSFNFIGIR